MPIRSSNSCGNSSGSPSQISTTPNRSVASSEIQVRLGLASIAHHAAVALEHGGDAVRIELAQQNGDVVLAIADDGSGIEDAPRGTGLSIVEALVRDELGGTLSLANDGGLRAEVVFPA